MTSLFDRHVLDFRLPKTRRDDARADLAFTALRRTLRGENLYTLRKDVVSGERPGQEPRPYQRLIHKLDEPRMTLNVVRAGDVAGVKWDLTFDVFELETPRQFARLKKTFLKFVYDQDHLHDPRVRRCDGYIVIDLRVEIGVLVAPSVVL